MWTLYKLQSVFIDTMMRAIYSSICKHRNIFLGKKSLIVPTVMLFSYFFFQCFGGFLMPICFALQLKVKNYSLAGQSLAIACKWSQKFAKSQNSLRKKRFLQIGLWMMHIIYSIKTGCSFQNVHISGFQNSLQTKFDLYISVCQSHIKKKQSITGDPVRAAFYQTYYETFHFEKKESK